MVAVGRAGTLSTAAAELRVSQPALSVAITQVEERVGEILFLRRKGVAITLTAFGRLFLKEAEELLARAADLEQPGRLSAKRQASVTIGILDELAPRWLAPILVLLRTSFPDTAIRARAISFNLLAEALLTGRIDVGLTYDLGLDATFQRDLLMHAAPGIWVPPGDALASRVDVSIEEIADRPLILSDQDLSIQHMLGLFRRVGLTPVVRHRAASIELLRSLAANGEGTGLSYTNPPGMVTYDGKPIVRCAISDRFAVEPVVFASVGRQPSPLPEIRQAVCSLAGASPSS